MGTVTTPATASPTRGALASFGSGSGSRAANTRAAGAPRRAASRATIANLRGRAGRMNAAPGRGRQARRASAAALLQELNGTRRISERRARQIRELLRNTRNPARG